MLILYNEMYKVLSIWLLTHIICLQINCGVDQVPEKMCIIFCKSLQPCCCGFPMFFFFFKQLLYLIITSHLQKSYNCSSEMFSIPFPELLLILTSYVNYGTSVKTQRLTLIQYLTVYSSTDLLWCSRFSINVLLFQDPVQDNTCCLFIH